LFERNLAKKVLTKLKPVKPVLYLLQQKWIIRRTA
jgi:hypothetical protein